MTHDALDALSHDYWEAVLAEEPLFATQVGDRRYDGRLRDPSPEGRAAWLASLEAFAAREAAIDDAALDAGARVTRSALREALRSDLAHLRTGVDDWTVDPLEGPQVEFENVESYQPLATPHDGGAMVARWRAMGPYVDATIANLRRSLAEGRVAARTPVAKSMAELDQLAATADVDLALLAPARADHADWEATDLAAFRADLADAVRRVVRPAFARFRAVLADEILPAARPDDRAGIVHVPGGADAYRDLIRYHTSLDLTAEDLHTTGVEEIARIDAEFVALGERVLGTRGLDETLARLRDDPALHFATREEVVAVAEASLARARAALPEAFGILPRADCAVVPMGPHEEEHSTIAYYRQPAPDGSRPGQYYLNTSAPTTRPRYEAEALAFHESIPGHHLQIAIGQELDRDPRVPAPPGPHCLLRGLGAVHGAPLRRDGPLLRRPRPVRDPLVRRVARVPSRRGHGHARARLEPELRDRLHGRAHGARREQHRERGGPVHRLARPGPRVQDRPAGDPPAAGRGARRHGTRVRHPRVPRRDPLGRRAPARDAA